jgi:hypothetical protein
LKHTPHARFFLSLADARTIVAFIEASLAWSDAISSYHSLAISYAFQRHISVDMLHTHVFLRYLSAEGAQLGWEVGVSSSSSPPRDSAQQVHSAHNDLYPVRMVLIASTSGIVQALLSDYAQDRSASDRIRLDWSRTHLEGRFE